MLAMDVNDDACIPNKHVALTSIASELAPTRSDARSEQRLMLTTLLRAEHEHTMAATLELQPGEVDFRVQRLDVHLAVAHFDNQQALLGQVIRRLGKHAPHQVQTVITAGQAQFRFVLVFVRHVGEIFRIDVGLSLIHI